MELSGPRSDADMTAEQKLYVLNALQVVGDWSVHDDGNGRLFYYNRKTDSSQWEVPDDLMSLETEFMMKLMLQNAVARSGVWTANDTGNGTLYYFNAKTRESVWERPGEWGEAEAAAAEAETAREEAEQQKEDEKAAKREKKEKKKQKKHKKRKEKRDEEAEQKEVEAKDEAPAQEVEGEVPLTEEELQAEEERKVREQKRIEQFRAMLRDKNIMPLTKWSVALPQIAGDPRFMGVPTMDERRAIFEHFVEHRREDLKAEKKSKLKQAKKLFTELLREQFQLDSWYPNTTFSVFLSTLENHIDAERYKQIQDDALALLTLSAQEKIYAKAVADYKSEALKRDGEQLRLTKVLEEKLSTQDKTTMKWESDEVQKLIREFYSSAASSGESAALLSEQQQKQRIESNESVQFRDVDLRHWSAHSRVNTSIGHRVHESHAIRVTIAVGLDLVGDAVAAIADHSLVSVEGATAVEGVVGDARYHRRGPDHGLARAKSDRLRDLPGTTDTTRPRHRDLARELADNQHQMEVNTS
ncbi:hypothetical protein PC116_g15436 [Phytophthora cactorum]|nr:hypothetical protein PC116_g15436 [Phytophthora cactorum]